MIEAVIFDWAGTTVDYGCMAPVEAFRKSFAEVNITVSNAEIREPMGKLKIDHIRSMLAMPRIYDAFYSQYQRAYDEDDVMRIYKQFTAYLMSTISQYTTVKPYVLETIHQLRSMDIKIGSTTGYTDEMMEQVLRDAKRQGYCPDYWVSPDRVNGKGRPNPFMIFKNMEYLEIDDVRKVVKVGDTISDIEEGKHAGVYTIGVLEGSSLIGLSETEFKSLDDTTFYDVLQHAKDAYFKAGADAVIMNIKELIPWIKQHQRKDYIR